MGPTVHLYPRPWGRAREHFFYRRGESARVLQLRGEDTGMKLLQRRNGVEGELKYIPTLRDDLSGLNSEGGRICDIVHPSPLTPSLKKTPPQIWHQVF